MAEVVLIRHGETTWSADGRHTSVTDLPLTERGQDRARAIAATLSRRRFVAVLASPRQRALQTARLAGLTVTEVDPGLAEWDYGSYEGRTTADIRTERPGWSLWTDGAPGGESPAQVAGRADRALIRLRGWLSAADGEVAVISHGHFLRVLAARWIGFDAEAGGALRLDTATLSVLGFEHDRPVLTRWNAPG